MKIIRLGSSIAIVLILTAALWGSLSFTRSALGSPGALPAVHVTEPQTPAPHLGYGLNIRQSLTMAQGMGFEWIKLYEDNWPSPNALPAGAENYRILYRVKAEGQPFSLDAYLAHVRELALAGRGKIHAYEIGNEPNLWMFWGQQSPDPGRYGRLLCNVYTTIKAVDPQAIIVSGGLAPVGRTSPQIWNLAMDDRVFTQRMLEAIRAAYPAQFPCFDAFGYHPQGFPYPPEIDASQLPPDDNGNDFRFRSSEWYHALMDVNGIGDHPIWLTEFGWLRDPIEDPYYGSMSYQNYGWCNSRSDFSAKWMRVPETTQADYLVRAFQYADAHMPWIGGMFVFNIDWNTEGWECASDKYFSIYKATTGLPDTDPRTKVPSLAVSALTAMPKRSAFAAPTLSVEPGALTFLAEVLTPTVQTQTLHLSTSGFNQTVTWTVSLNAAPPFSLLVSPLSGAQSADVAVRLNTSAVTTPGSYEAQLLITAQPTSTNGAPFTVPVTLIPVDHLQRSYLPLIAQNYTAPQPVVSSTSELGLAFVSSAEAPANETRYQRAQAIGSHLNRWPMYWPQIEKNPVGQPRVFDWSAQDANITADLNRGLTVLPILMLTPIGLDTGGSLLVQPPKVGDGLRRQMQDRSINLPSAPSSQSSPPQGLYLSVFSDGSDEPGPGKTINPNNRWAVFVNAAVNRYKPGGSLAQAQGWTGDKGVRHWEIWNEEDLSFFFSGTPADFARIQKVAYLAAKHTDPNAIIVFGGLAHFEKPTWLNDVLNVIATDPMSTTYNGFMDAVASHSYSWAWQTFGYLFEDRARLNARGLTGVKLWLTETGLPVCDDPPYVFCASPYRGSMSEQADYLIQTVAWATWLNTEKIIWFQLYDDAGNDCQYDAFGLVRNPPTGPCTARDGSPRLAHTTFNVARQHLTGVQPYWRDRRTGATTHWSGNQEILAFKRPATGERIVTMWARKNMADTVILTATSTSAVLITPDGSSQTITPVNGVYSINLPAATNYSTPTNDGSAAIGGSPRILVELDPAVQ
jgi:hypothetical protein